MSPSPNPVRGRLLFLTVVGLAALFVAYELRAVLNPLLLALLLAYVLNPIVDRLERRGVPRSATVCGLYAILLGGAGLSLAVAVPSVWRESVTFYQATVRGDAYQDLNADGRYTPGEPLSEDLNSNARYDVAYLERWKLWTDVRLREWNRKFPRYRVDVDTLLDRMEATLTQHAGQIAEKGIDVTGFLAKLAVSGIAGAYTVLSYAVLVPIYLFFFMRGLHDLHATFVSFLPPAHRDRIQQVLVQIHVCMTSFFRGKLVICTIKGLVLGLGLWAFGIPFPVVYGALEGVGSLIPFLPVVIGFVPALSTTAFDAGFDPVRLGVVTFFFLGVEALEGFVLNPLVLGKETGLHPVTLIVVLLAGAELFGLFGVLLAVPVACIVKILGREFVLPVFRDLGAGRSTPVA